VSVRRNFLLAIVLSLATVIALPCSACDLSYCKNAACEGPKAPCQCDRMGMEDHCTQVAAQSGGSCCVQAPMPMPVAQYKAPDVSPASVPAVVIGTLQHLPLLSDERAAKDMQGLPPPALQPLLCTFLI
jgi:hypothetical protein